MKKVGVLGAGIMGAGIAQVTAQAGYEVILVDISDDFLQRGLDSIKNSLSRLLKKGKITEEDLSKTIDQIKTTTAFEDLKDCDMIIEAIPEIISLKKKTYKELDNICKPECIFASNTSAISITDLASSVSKERQSKFIGLHFFNPVPMMKLVEIIRAEQTSDDTYTISNDYCHSIKKETVVIADFPGFATTRMVAIIINEAIYMLQEGLGTKEDIDKAMKLALAHPMGPLTLADLIGLDTILHILEYLTEEFGQKYQPCPLLKKMVRAGKLGRKTKEGFYKY